YLHSFLWSSILLEKVLFLLQNYRSESIHDRSAVAMLLQVPCSQWIDERLFKAWRKPSALEKRSITQQFPFRAVFTFPQP
ncbi:MAG: hypothetical protein ACKOAU_18805, partial [Pirellula sp.]